MGDLKGCFDLLDFCIWEWLARKGSKGEQLTCNEGNKNVQQTAMTVLDGAWSSMDGGSFSYRMFYPCGGSCSTTWLMLPQLPSPLSFTGVASLLFPNASCCICPHPCFWHVVNACISAHWGGKGRQTAKCRSVFLPETRKNFEWVHYFIPVSLLNWLACGS